MFKIAILLTALLGISSISQADVLCKPTPVYEVMIKSNGDIIYHDWYQKRRLAFKASEMPEYLASVIMTGLTEMMVRREGNRIVMQASYPDGYDCKNDDLSTAPLRIFFDQTRGRRG